MIYLIDFNNQPLGLYTRSPYGEKYTVPPHDGQILSTDPDLEAFAVMPNEMMYANFFPVTIPDILAGKVSADAMKHTKHFVLIHGWEIIALLSKVHSDCFELSHGGEKVWAVSFGIGEPLA